MSARSSGECATRDRRARRDGNGIVSPASTYRAVTIGCTYDARQIAGVFPSSAATNRIASATFRRASASDVGAPSSASTVAARNVPPHVQAARLYAERGLTPPARGDWVEYVVTTIGPEPAAAARAPLDYQHYIERQLAPVADGILPQVGTSFRALVDRQLELF